MSAHALRRLFVTILCTSMVAIGVAFAPSASAAQSCSPRAYFTLNAYGYMEASHSAACEAGYYTSVVITSALNVNGQKVDGFKTFTHGPSSGPRTYAGLGTSGRNAAGTQTFCAYTRVDWVTGTAAAGTFSNSCVTR